MEFLHKLFFFDPAGQKSRELFIATDAIDFITWYKLEGKATDATLLHTNLMIDPVHGKQETKTPSNLIRHVVSGNPEMANNITFEGLFFKVTVQYTAESGGVKKYTAWVNPDNIMLYYSLLPGVTEVFFKSGNCLLLSNNPVDFFKNLKAHVYEYKERRKSKYATQQG